MSSPILGSARLTPFLGHFELDMPPVVRMREQQRQLGVDGLMLPGTLGEGPQAPDGQRKQLPREAVALSGEMPGAVQPGNGDLCRERREEFLKRHFRVQCSATPLARVLNQMKVAARAGTRLTVVSHPTRPLTYSASIPPNFISGFFPPSADVFPVSPP